jgi:hypothetical protein
MVTEASGVSLDNGQTFLTPPRRQCYDRLNQNYFEIIVWHLTPRWKIILMGSDPVKMNSSQDFFLHGLTYARSIWFLHETDNYF